MSGRVLAALVQMRVTADKAANLRAAAEWIARCAGEGAALVMLPEMFCCPYDAALFPQYAEAQGGPAWQMLSQSARRAGVTLVGGSLPEIDAQGRIYNTCYLFDAQGQPIGRHRKMHLFDIDVEKQAGPGGQGAPGQRFRESDTLTPGADVTVAETAFGALGAAICYDVRFPELARLMALRGARVLAYPGAFNMTTGPAHWEVLFRARALDNQCWALGCAPARDETAGYVSYGNSIAVDPWGRVAGRLGPEESRLLVEIDLEMVERVRRELPLLRHRRADVYELEETAQDGAGR